MKPEREKSVELKARDDAERDQGAGLVDLVTLGLASNSSYNPPSDSVEKAIYDHAWRKAKGE